MSLIGHAFNKALQKSIPVYIAKSGDGFIRLTDAISQNMKDMVLAKVKQHFENGSLFKVDDMKLMEQLTVTNMSSYLVQGEDTNGNKIKGGHAPANTSKQTQAK